MLRVSGGVHDIGSYEHGEPVPHVRRLDGVGMNMWGVTRRLLSTSM